MDPFSALIGFVVGVIATAFAVELGLKKLFKPVTTTKLTATWRLEEIGAGLVASVDAADTQFPKGSRIVTAGRANPDAYVGREHRQHPGARGNFVVHPDKDRALLFLGPVAPGTMALSTVDPHLCARLRHEHARLWGRADAYIEEVPLSEAAGRHNVRVRTRGQVQSVIQYRDRHLMRLVDGNHVVGVLVDSPLDLAGAIVSVTGQATKGTSGYTLIDAEEVRRIEPATRTSRPGERVETTVLERTPMAQDGPVVQPTVPAAPLPRRDDGVLRIPAAFQDPRDKGPDVHVPDAAPVEPRRSLAESGRTQGRFVVHR